MLEDAFNLAYATEHKALERAVEETARQIPVNGRGVLALWVEKLPSYPDITAAFLQPSDIIIDSRLVTPGSFAHEYGHFLDLRLGLRHKWFRAVATTPEYVVWRGEQYLSHPGEMVARFVEQLVAGDCVKGAYSRKTFMSLRPQFIRMVTDALA